MARRKPNDKDLAERKLLADCMVVFRKNNLLTQKDLAEVLDLSRRTIQMIESGSITPHPTTLKAFNGLVAKYQKAKEISIK